MEVWRNEKSENRLKSNLGASQFGQSIAKVAVAQICESRGFQGFQLSALETLSDIAIRYIHNLGKTSQCNASLAGRTECSVFDILQGLEDLGSGPGFSGASDISHCIGNSGMSREIIQYVNETKATPFAYSIPRFPVHRERIPGPSFLQSGNEPPGEHVPTWLPKFPDSNTYVHSSRHDEGAMDSCKNKILQARNQMKPERSLLNFKQYMDCNGPDRRHPLLEDDFFIANHAVEINPFLAAPLQGEEKKVSMVPIPPKFSKAITELHPAENHLSVLETFIPSVEAVKSGSSNAGVQDKILSKQRFTVQFKIGVGNNSFLTGKDLSLQKKGFEKTVHLLGKDNDKDDKKRRDVKIRKEFMDNAQELRLL